MNINQCKTYLRPIAILTTLATLSSTAMQEDTQSEPHSSASPDTIAAFQDASSIFNPGDSSIIEATKSNFGIPLFKVTKETENGQPFKMTIQIDGHEFSVVRKEDFVDYGEDRLSHAVFDTDLYSALAHYYKNKLPLLDPNKRLFTKHPILTRSPRLATAPFPQLASIVLHRGDVALATAGVGDCVVVTLHRREAWNYYGSAHVDEFVSWDSLSEFEQDCRQSNQSSEMKAVLISSAFSPKLVGIYQFLQDKGYADIVLSVGEQNPQQAPISPILTTWVLRTDRDGNKDSPYKVCVHPRNISGSMQTTGIPLKNLVLHPNQYYQGINGWSEALQGYFSYLLATRNAVDDFSEESWFASTKRAIVEFNNAQVSDPDILPCITKWAKEINLGLRRFRELNASYFDGNGPYHLSGPLIRLTGHDEIDFPEPGYPGR